MMIAGGCYCGKVRYEAKGEPFFKAQCHCRECQYISGGAENVFAVMSAAGFRYVAGEPASYTRADLATPVTREFCATCGTPLTTRLPHDDATVIVKVGSMDDPAGYGGPQAAIWTKDMQPFHLIPDGIPTFEGMPGA